MKEPLQQQPRKESENVMTTPMEAADGKSVSTADAELNKKINQELVKMGQMFTIQTSATNKTKVDDDVELIEHIPKIIPTVVVDDDSDVISKELNAFLQQKSAAAAAKQQQQQSSSSSSSTPLNPVKQVIRKVMESVPTCMKHVELIMKQQMNEQDEELKRYFARELAQIDAQIRKTQEETPTELSPIEMIEIDRTHYRRMLNNRSSKLSRLNRKRREEMMRLSLFSYKQFNAGLIEESNRFRAKIQIQLQFLAQAGIDIDKFLSKKDCAPIAPPPPPEADGPTTIKQEPLDA